jgi:hypothetical protein
VGTALLRMLADRSGLTDGLSAALSRRGWWPVHDRGRVLADLAVMIADGGESIADIDVLRHQGEVFGVVASPTTCWRTLNEIGRAQRRRISRARARVRARVWALMGQVPVARAAGRDIGPGVVVLDVDATIVIAHSDKDQAAPTYKHTYGFHPILVTCDNTGEMLAVLLRPGNAGANTAVDHLTVLGEAIGQIPAVHRRHLLVRGDSAAATHAVLDWLVEQDRRRGRTVEYSLGWAIGEAERAAITALSPQAWSPALDTDGDLRDGAEVAELTGRLDLAGCRRECAWSSDANALTPAPSCHCSKNATAGATPRSSRTPASGSCSGWRPATGPTPGSRTASAARKTPACAVYPPATSTSTTPGAPPSRSLRT